MDTSIELLRSHLGVLLRASGASSAALFAGRFAGATAHPLILHEGDAPPVPELASAEAAEKLHEAFP